MADEKNTQEQRATNLALVMLAKDGNSFALNQLYEVNRGFINSQVWKWYSKHKHQCENAGFEKEDLESEAFFAMEAAAKNFDETKGIAFITYLKFYITNVLQKAIIGSHRKTIKTDEGKEYQVSADPLHSCDSLDTPLPGGEDSNTSGIALVPDPSAEQPFSDILENDYQSKLATVVRSAVSRLPETRKRIIELRWLNSESKCSNAKVGEELGVSGNRIAQQEKKALEALRMDASLIRWRDSMIAAGAYNGTGFQAWKRNGSVEERIVERMEYRGLYKHRARFT